MEKFIATISLTRGALDTESFEEMIDRIESFGTNRLNVESNNLFRIPEEMGRLTTLTSLNISKNNLTNLPSGLSKLSNLQHLNVSNNKLEVLDLQGLQSLKTLEASYLPLKDLKGLPDDLSFLILTSCKFDAFPCFVVKFVNLTHLSVPNNSISSIPGHISKLSNLIMFDISHNPIREIPKTLNIFKNLIIIAVETLVNFGFEHFNFDCRKLLKSDTAWRDIPELRKKNTKDDRIFITRSFKLLQSGKYEYFRLSELRNISIAFLFLKKTSLSKDLIILITDYICI